MTIAINEDRQEKKIESILLKVLNTGIKPTMFCGLVFLGWRKYDNMEFYEGVGDSKWNPNAL